MDDAEKTRDERAGECECRTPAEIGSGDQVAAESFDSAKLNRPPGMSIPPRSTLRAIRKRTLTNQTEYHMNYHMDYTNQSVRTSMSLDTGTLGILAKLAKRWSVSKAEVMRRAVRRLDEEAAAEDSRPSPLQALKWLQDGGGLKVAEGEEFKAAIQAERQAKRYWWE